VSDETEAMELPYPHYVCPSCGKDLPLAEARLTVTCADHQPRVDAVDFVVRDATPADRHAIEAICDQAWGETEIDVFGRTFDVLACQNLIADAGGELAGLVSTAVDGGELAIVAFSVYPAYQGRDIGSALLRAAVEQAAAKGLPAVKAAVSNDDIPTLYFLQRHGYTITGVVIGVLADRLGYAGCGFAGIPMRDEIRLRRSVA
jgi:ribosomal protein S18 acetylase RimI-like enzyme